MMFTCNTRKLKAAMSMVKRAMELVVMTSLEVLQAVKIVAVAGEEGLGTVAFVGTDLEVMIGTEIEAHVEEAGDCGIAWKSLNFMLPKDPGAEDLVEIWWENGKVNVQEGALHQSAQAQSMLDFPLIPNIPLTQKLDFGAAVGRCFPFMSTETDRMAINGVHICADGERLDVVATDGRVFKLLSFPHKAVIKKQFAFTLNRRASAAVRVKFCDEVEIGINPTTETMHIHGPKGELITKSVPPPYPDYTAVLAPALSMMNDGVEVELEIHELLEKVERMCYEQFNCKDMDNVFPITFKLIDGVIELRYENPKKDISMQDCITPQCSNGELYFGVNPLYLRDCLKAIDHRFVTIYAYPGDTKGSYGHCTLRPILLVPSAWEEYRDCTVLMPFRLEPIEPEAEAETKEKTDNGKPSDPDNG